jgi:hypothetical protein
MVKVALSYVFLKFREKLVEKKISVCLKKNSQISKIYFLEKYKIYKLWPILGLMAYFLFLEVNIFGVYIKGDLILLIKFENFFSDPHVSFIPP